MPLGPPSLAVYSDGKYQSFGYDDYGNKVWEENQLRQCTTYTYDAYKRLVKTKIPLRQGDHYNYDLTNGNQDLLATLHTTASVHLTTTQNFSSRHRTDSVRDYSCHENPSGDQASRGSTETPQGAATIQPGGRVGPIALPMRTLSFIY